MMIKKIMKWFCCVCISYALIFTFQFGNIFQAIAYVLDTADQEGIYFMDSTVLEEECKYFQEELDSEYTTIIEDDYLDESMKTRDLELQELYQQYPVGVVMLTVTFSLMDELYNIKVVSFGLGIVIGTAVFFLIQDKEKKYLKVLLLLYLLSFFFLGLLEGTTSVSGNNLTVFSGWTFPGTYILPVTGVFLIIIGLRIFRQRMYAKEFNENLNRLREIEEEEE